MSKRIIVLDVRHINHARFLAEARLENINGFCENAEREGYRPEIDRLRRLIKALDSAKALTDFKKRGKK